MLADQVPRRAVREALNKNNTYGNVTVDYAQGRKLRATFATADLARSASREIFTVHSSQEEDISPGNLYVDRNFLISSGTYGDVFGGRLGGSEVVIKIPRSGAIGALSSINSTEIGSFKAEAALLKRIRHPNIVTFLGTCITGNVINLVFERLSCNLDSLIHDPMHLPHDLSYLQRGLTLKIKFHIARDIIVGIEFLHNTKRIVHRDIKPGNVLVDRHLNAKVADFGFGKWFQPGTLAIAVNEPTCGTTLYMAPELVRNTRPASTSSDIYALALLIWEMLTENVLFKGEYTDVDDLKAKLAAKPHLHPEVPPNLPHPHDQAGSHEPVPPSLRELLERSLQLDPDQRPSISEVLSLFDRAWGEYAISSTPARFLWAQLSENGPVLADEVAWTHFASVVAAVAQVPLHSFVAVQTLACVGQTVSIERFDLLCKCFGDFFMPNSGLLNEMNVLCSQPWFVPFATLEDAERALSSAAEGTFLVRLNQMSPVEHPMVVSRQESGNVIHRIVRKDGPLKYSYLSRKGKVFAASTPELVMVLAALGEIKIP
ncbi:Dual specificity protein kinase [Pelomyxa schiedti]|nr:Dual specificity protein kinase [Pelomyxa schiedti]